MSASAVFVIIEHGRDVTFETNLVGTGDVIIVKLRDFTHELLTLDS